MHGVQDPELELGREVHQEAERSEQQHVGCEGDVGEAEHARQGGVLVDDGHRLLGAHHGDGDHGHAGPHGDLDESAPAEPAQLVTLPVQLAGALGALREHENELLLLPQEAVRVLGVYKPK